MSKARNTLDQIATGLLPDPTGMENKRLTSSGTVPQWHDMSGLRFQDINRDGHGYRFDLALGFDGRVYIWGYNNNHNTAGAGQGKHIQGFEEVCIPVDYDVQKVTQFGGMAQNGYVLFDNGDLWGWGWNNRGQCGTGNTSPVQVPTLAHTGVLELCLPRSEAYHHEYGMVYIRKSDGWYGFGANANFSRFGDGYTTANVSTPRKLGDLPDGGAITRLWNLGNHRGCTYALSEHGNLYGVSDNGYGCLGIGNASVQSTWQLIPLAGNSVKDIMGGYTYHSGAYSGYMSTAFLLTDGMVKTVGSNLWGQLGRTTAGDSHSIVDTGLTGIDELYSIGGGPLSLYATVPTRDKIYVWGHNAQGQLGIGNTANQWTPQQIDITYKRLWIDPFQNGHTYGWYQPVYLEKDNGDIWSVGANSYGVLMTGDATNRNVFTKTLFSSKRIKKICTNNDGNGSLSWVHVLLDDGTLYGAGYGGTYGVLGLYNSHVISPNYISRRML
ncbi:RCC1 domain-containing protein [Endozoicomonas ascidiicola]|uniref:RCC1 domain-containing protein n=1 Tax=Endozoicomonas ascidiicola TaxID=1698521 RepID=UPI000830BB03|nr:hypothetical protein [Endozoicomonas ascidiicola]